MLSDEVGVCPYRIGERLGYTPRLAMGLHTLQSEFPFVLGRKVSERLAMIKSGADYSPAQGL